MTPDPAPGSLHELFWNSKSNASPGMAIEWLRRLNAHVSTVMRVRGLPRLEAERVAYEIILVERLNATHPNTDPNRCAWCGKAETPTDILRPHGVGVRHAWLHSGCWERWRERRRAEAVGYLATMKIEAP